MRITPVVRGTVMQVSADRLTKKRTDNPYYVALVRIDENDLAELPHVRLYPGMPTTVSGRTARDVIQPGVPSTMTLKYTPYRRVAAPPTRHNGPYVLTDSRRAAPT
jgi:hypothetical protein